MIPTWTSEAKDLKRQRGGLERDVAVALQALRKDVPALVSELDVLRQSLEADRVKERTSLLQQIDRLKILRHQLREAVTSTEGPASLKKLKLLISSLETALGTFRDAQRRAYEAVRKEELDLTEDLARAETDVAEWDKEIVLDLEARLRKDVAPPQPPVVAFRKRSSSASALYRSARAGDGRVAPPQPPSRPKDDAVGFVEDEEARAQAAAEKARKLMEFERKKAALEVYRLQKQAEALRVEQEAQEKRLQEQKRQVAEAERQAKKRAVVAQYRRERELEAAMLAEAKATQRHVITQQDQVDMDRRIREEIEAAALKHQRVEAVPIVRSEKMLLAAAMRQKATAISGPLSSQDASHSAQRLYSSTTVAAQARMESTAEERISARDKQHGAHDTIVPSSAGADRKHGISYTFGTGSARAIPAWRSSS